MFLFMFILPIIQISRYRRDTFQKIKEQSNEYINTHTANHFI